MSDLRPHLYAIEGRIAFLMAQREVERESVHHALPIDIINVHRVLRDLAKVVRHLAEAVEDLDR